MNKMCGILKFVAFFILCSVFNFVPKNCGKISDVLIFTAKYVQSSDICGVFEIHKNTNK